MRSRITGSSASESWSGTGYQRQYPHLALDQLPMHLRRLQQAQGKILYAHSDLSGLSLFEEASWWGYQAALKALPT